MRPSRHRGEGAKLLEVYRLRATPAVDAELNGFFSVAESEMGHWRTPEDHADAALAHRRILGWLRAMPNNEAGVLQATYESRDWPRAVRAEFGRLTGVAVRLTCSLEEWPEDRRSQEAMDMAKARDLEARCAARRTEARVLESLRRRAERRLAEALGVYLEVRGTGPRVVRAS
jgi:hypothetical protein